MDGVPIRPFDDAEAGDVASWMYDLYDRDPTQFTDYLSVDAEGCGF